MASLCPLWITGEIQPGPLSSGDMISYGERQREVYNEPGAGQKPDFRRNSQRCSSAEGVSIAVSMPSYHPLLGLSTRHSNGILLALENVFWDFNHAACLLLLNQPGVPWAWNAGRC